MPPFVRQLGELKTAIISRQNLLTLKSSLLAEFGISIIIRLRIGKTKYLLSVMYDTKRALE